MLVLFSHPGVERDSHGERPGCPVQWMRISAVNSLIKICKEVMFLVLKDSLGARALNL